MPFAFPSCHCEEALAEADVAIQSGSLCALPVVPLDCRVAYAPRNDNAECEQEAMEVCSELGSISVGVRLHDKPFALPFFHCEPFGARQSMPFVFSSCHCEEALAEAEVAIQRESLWALPYGSAGLPRRLRSSQ
jgi:hypothetical protein